MGGITKEHQELVTIGEALREAIELLATSADAPVVRLSHAWPMIESIRRVPICSRLPEEFISKVDKLEHQLTRFGGFEATLQQLTADEVRDRILLILSLGDSYERAIRSLSKNKSKNIAA